MDGVRKSFCNRCRAPYKFMHENTGLCYDCTLKWQKQTPAYLVEQTAIYGSTRVVEAIEKGVIVTADKLKSIYPSLAADIDYWAKHKRDQIDPAKEALRVAENDPKFKEVTQHILQGFREMEATQIAFEDEAEQCILEMISKPTTSWKAVAEYIIETYLNSPKLKDEIEKVIKENTSKSEWLQKKKGQALQKDVTSLEPHMTGVKKGGRPKKKAQESIEEAIKLKDFFKNALGQVVTFGGKITDWGHKLVASLNKLFGKNQDYWADALVGLKKLRQDVQSEGRTSIYDDDK